MMSRFVTIGLLAIVVGALSLEGCGAADADERPGLPALTLPLLAPVPSSPRDRARAVLDALPAPSRDGLTRALTLEDPSGAALASFHDALARTARGEHTARLAFYGGSHTASDLYTGEIRARLQESFGDAGHGFVLAVPPISQYWQHGVRVADAEGWTVIAPSSKHMGIEHYGLAGMAFEANEPAWAEVETERSTASRIDVLYMRQPEGGVLEIDIDGTTHELATRADEMTPATARFTVRAGSHRVALRTRGEGPVRVFGVVLELDGPGVVVDQLAIAGAKARHQLLWDETTWDAFFSARVPDLVVVSYGNNELDDHHLTSEQHEAHFVSMIERLRRHAPRASCVVLGPSERQMPSATGAWEVPSALSFFVEMQRRVARSSGCAFVDVLAWQGGPGAVERWMAARPPLEREDRVHFTELGYRRLGTDLVRVLLEGMARSSE